MGPLNLAFTVQDEHYCSDTTTTAKSKLCQRRMEWVGVRTETCLGHQNKGDRVLLQQKFASRDCTASFSAEYNTMFNVSVYDCTESEGKKSHQEAITDLCHGDAVIKVIV